jgi:hypothetical protein
VIEHSRERLVVKPQGVPQRFWVTQSTKGSTTNEAKSIHAPERLEVHRSHWEVRLRSREAMRESCAQQARARGT